MNSQSANRPVDGPEQDGGTRRCPFCDASIPSGWVFCQHCDRFSNPTNEKIVRSSSKASIVERINRALGTWETSNPRIVKTLQRSRNSPVIVPLGFRLAIGVAFLTLAAAMCVAWLSPFGDPYSGRGALAAAMMGTAFCLGPRLLRKTNAVLPANGSPSLNSIRFLGFDISLPLAQVTAFVAMGIWGSWLQLPNAMLAAFVTIAIGVPLHNTPAKPGAAIMTIVAAIGIIVFVFTDSWDLFYYKTSAHNYEYLQPDYVVLIKSGARGILWSLAIMAMLPQLQLISLNGVSVGRLKGDFGVRLFGTEVLVALTSAVLLVCAWLVGGAVWNASRWIVPFLYGQGLHA